MSGIFRSWLYQLVLLSGPGLFISHTLAQSTESIAYWTFPRANLLGHSIYINSGDRFDGGAMDSNRSSSIVIASLMSLDLSLPYTDLAHSSNLHVRSLTSQSTPPFYVGGAMFVSYDGIMTYGGMKSENDSMINDSMFSFNLSSNATNSELKSLQPPKDKDPWTWYRCCGADVSVPSENLAFYFGGLTSDVESRIYYQVSAGEPGVADKPSGDLIICDITILDQPVCERLSTEDAGIEPRAESELVWVPYGSQGSLILIGGILIPSDLQIAGIMPSYDSTNDTNNYMTEVLIFDIASRTWMSQQTAGAAPSQRASFCSVVTAVQGNKKVKSHHIYIYGGYDGTYMTGGGQQAYDDVWVLSLPAFRWTQITGGDTSHRRQNHKCVKTSPSQFFTIGGNMEYGIALDSSYMYVFDMNEGVWNSSYDPTYWSDFVVPETITRNIGDVNMIPDDLVDDVKKLLSTPYKGKVKDLQSYATLSLKQWAKRKGASWWLATIIAVLAYLTVASCALIAVVCLRRKMAYRSAKIDMSDMTSKNHVIRWMHDAPMKSFNSIAKTKTSSSQEQYSDTLAESYTDEERSIRDITLGQTKTTGAQVTAYERLNVGDSDDVELRSLTGSASK